MSGSVGHRLPFQVALSIEVNEFAVATISREWLSSGNYRFMHLPGPSVFLVRRMSDSDSSEGGWSGGVRSVMPPKFRHRTRVINWSHTGHLRCSCGWFARMGCCCRHIYSVVTRFPTERDCTFRHHKRYEAFHGRDQDWTERSSRIISSERETVFVGLHPVLRKDTIYEVLQWYKEHLGEELLRELGDLSEYLPVAPLDSDVEEEYENSDSDPSEIPINEVLRQTQVGVIHPLHEIPDRN